MGINKVSGVFIVFSLLMVAGVAGAQAVYMPPQAAQSVSQPQLAQMLAPIALYPDALVAQILAAATNPVQVVEASRWLQQPENAALTGDQLAYALQQQPWDPSVKSLVAFPQTLAMMNNNLSWTQQIGQAFASNQPAVQDSLQRLRAQAQAAGSLISTPQQTIGQQDGAITITPVSSGLVSVPCYSPGVVYGAWPNPSYPPVYLSQPSGLACDGQYMSFAPPVTVIDTYWGGNDWDWHHGNDNRNRFQVASVAPRAPQIITTETGPRPIIYGGTIAPGPVIATAPAPVITMRESVQQQPNSVYEPQRAPAPVMPEASRMQPAPSQASVARPMANAAPQNSDAHGHDNNSDDRQ